MEIVAGFCCTGFNLIYRNISLCCVNGTELLSVRLSVSATEMCSLREKPSRVRPHWTLRGVCELCQHLIWTPFPITHGLGSSVSANTALLSAFPSSVTNDNDTAKRFFSIFVLSLEPMGLMLSVLLPFAFNFIGWMCYRMWRTLALPLRSCTLCSLCITVSPTVDSYNKPN